MSGAEAGCLIANEMEHAAMQTFLCGRMHAKHDGCGARKRLSDVEWRPLHSPRRSEWCGLQAYPGPDRLVLPSAPDERVVAGLPTVAFSRQGHQSSPGSDPLLVHAAACQWLILQAPAVLPPRNSMLPLQLTTALCRMNPAAERGRLVTDCVVEGTKWLA